MPLPFVLAGAAVVFADLFMDRKVNQHIDEGSEELETELKIQKKKYNAWTTKSIVFLAMLLFFMILGPTWLALVFFIFIAILLFMKNPRKNPRKYLRMFMKYLWLHKFNLHSAIDAFIDHFARAKVKEELNRRLGSLESALIAMSGFSPDSIESEIFSRSSNYNVLKTELRNSILRFFSCLVFLILLVLYLIALAWSEYGFW